jgi:GR25 family glycosyltransferase involved in LPS biosynthesis
VNRCVFINLDEAAERRSQIEASFGRTVRAGWSLERFPALGPPQVSDVPGSLSPAEKGCFASHSSVIAARLDDDDHLFVAEDDAVFSPQTFALVDQLFANQTWDVIFTDAALCDLALMLQLARQRDAMVARGEYNSIDLKGRSFFGATAYAVRGSSKRRLHAALAARTSLDLPYDLALRDLCHEGALRMAVCFPFVTTVAAQADASQIQGGEHAVFDQTLNAFRRLMYVARDLDICRRDAADLGARCDGPSRMVGTVFAAMASAAFPLDR